MEENIRHSIWKEKIEKDRLERKLLGLSPSTRFYGAGRLCYGEFPELFGLTSTIEHIRAEFSEQSREKYFDSLRKKEPIIIIKQIIEASKKQTPNYHIYAFGSSVHNSNGINNEYSDIDLLFHDPLSSRQKVRYNLTMSIGNKEMNFGQHYNIKDKGISISHKYLKYFIENFAPWINITRKFKKDSVNFDSCEGTFQPGYQNLNLKLTRYWSTNWGVFDLTFTPSEQLVRIIASKNELVVNDKFKQFKKYHPSKGIARKDIFPKGVELYNPKNKTSE